MFLVCGEYQDLLHRLFRQESDGRIVFGTATSLQPAASPEALIDWTDFSDYIMEGRVSYLLRVQQAPRGLIVEVRLKGMDRDKYIASSLQSYIRWAGVEPLSMGDET